MLIIHPSSIPELQHTPLPPKVLRVRERAPTPNSSVVFTLDSHLSLSKSLGLRQSMNRFKEKLVAKGYAQTYGIDYEETYNLVAKMTTIIVIIAMVAIKGWSLHQMDVKNVFFHGSLHEEVYME